VRRSWLEHHWRCANAPNTGPRFVGRPMEYKTHVRSAKVGRTGGIHWGVLTRVRACSTVPAQSRANTGPCNMLKAITASVLLLTALAAPANASCTQAQLAGIWTAQSVSAVGGQLTWTTCTLTINAAGAFPANKSACLDSLGVESDGEGSFKLFNAANCAFDGTVHFIGYGTNAYIRNLTLSIDHQTAAGIGGGGAYGGVFVFNMVKVK
jgi:hypothetical protein